MEFHKEEALEYAKIKRANRAGLDKVPYESIKNGEVIRSEEFLGRPYYIVKYYIGSSKQAEFACICEYREHEYAPVDLLELLPELSRWSPDGLYRLP